MFVIKDEDGNVSVVGSIDHAQLAELGIDEFGNPVVDENADLSKLLKAELVDRAEAVGIDTDGLTKAELVDALEAHQAETEPG